MTKTVVFIGAAAVPNISAQRDVDIIKHVFNALEIPFFASVDEAKAAEHEGFKGKIRYISVTAEVVEEPTDADVQAKTSVEGYQVLGTYPFDTESRD